VRTVATSNPNIVATDNIGTPTPKKTKT